MSRHAFSSDGTISALTQCSRYPSWSSVTRPTPSSAPDAPRSFVQSLSDTHRSHIGPDFFNVFQTLQPRSLVFDIAPTGRDGTLARPDRVLFLVIDDYHIAATIIFLFIRTVRPRATTRLR